MTYQKIYLVCSTIDLQSKYDCLPKQAVLPLSEESIGDVLEEQKRKNKQRVALIFDDVLGKMCFQKSNLFDYIASSCHHFRLHAFLLVQGLKNLSPTIRERDKRKTEKAPVFQVGDTVGINLSQGKNKFDQRLIKWSKENYPVQKVIKAKATEPWSDKG